MTIMHTLLIFYEKGCHTKLFHEKGCHTNLFHEKGCQAGLKRRMAKYMLGIIANGIWLLSTIGASRIGPACIYFRTSHTTYHPNGHGMAMVMITAVNCVWIRATRQFEIPIRLTISAVSDLPGPRFHEGFVHGCRGHSSPSELGNGRLRCCCC